MGEKKMRRKRRVEKNVEEVRKKKMDRTMTMTALNKKEVKR